MDFKTKGDLISRICEIRCRQCDLAMAASDDPCDPTEINMVARAWRTADRAMREQSLLLADTSLGVARPFARSHLDNDAAERVAQETIGALRGGNEVEIAKAIVSLHEWLDSEDQAHRYIETKIAICDLDIEEQRAAIKKATLDLEDAEKEARALRERAAREAA